MSLKEMVYHRRSTRSFTSQVVDVGTVEKIKSFVMDIKPLYPDIKVESEIVSKDDIKCILPWTTQQLIAVFSEDKEGAFENVGFIFQQLDLYMQSIGLGVCWLGMGRLNNQYIFDSKDDNMKFVIMLAFGYPNNSPTRSDVKEFKRRTLSEIADNADEKLEPARLAPSSVNSQPWYFLHDGNVIHAYCVKQGLFKSKTLGNMNRIDMGICLAHIYVENTETFEFFKVDKPKEIKGYGYIGSFII